MTKPRIVFMGTPEFAAYSLKHLLAKEFNIVGVVTVADKPAGRGQQIQESEVKKVAIAHQLSILQPLKLKDDAFIDELKAWNADLFVVIAFRMLPEVVWNMPPLGSINLHGSLLPKFRGAAPINHAIMVGEKETGVTTFFIEQEIDKGSILLQEKIDIDESETAGEIHDRLMVVGAALVEKTLNGIFSGVLKSIPQKEIQDDRLKHAPKIFRADCEINWNQKAVDVHNFIRGLSPYPGAWTTFELQGKKTGKIFLSRQTKRQISSAVGDVLVQEGQLFVQCEDYALEVLSIQIEGKKRVTTKDFLGGLREELVIHKK